MKPTHLLLTRHGQTVTNTEGRFCGHSETGLTPLGIEQARALGRRLARTRIDAVYTSDFSRAIDTAALILEGRRLTPAFEPDLRELHYGEWELLRERDVSRSAPWREEFGRMRAEDPSWRPPGGETIGEVRARTSDALDRIATAHPGRTVLVVTHGTAINCMLAEVLGMAPEFTFRIDVSNCGLNRLLFSRGRYTVLALNDTAHLAGVEVPR